MKTERITQITEALLSNESEVPALFEMSPADAAAKLVQKGFDFTEDELIEYGGIINEEKKHAEFNGELSEDALDNVSGGGLLAAAVAGVLVGYWIYGQKW